MPHTLKPVSRSLVLLLLAAALPLCAQTSSASFEQIDLFRSGDNGVNTYRIPALIETPKATLLAVADARRDSSSDLPGRISLVLRRSSDGGRHWQPIRTLLEAAEGGVGDASLLLDRSTGRIWCFHAFGPPGIGFGNARPGARTGPSTLQLHTIHSDDDGITWSAPVDLTPQIKAPAWQALFAASGTDIQTRTGRLLVPLVVRDARGLLHSANAYSDDHGSTWKAGPFIGQGTDESHNVELEGGVILQNMRNGPTRAIARSTDGGISFGPVTHDPKLIDPGCNAGITRYHSGQTDALIFTNAASTRRENLTVRLSYDSGRTWPVHRAINPGPSSYSTVIPLHDGSIAVLYERSDPGSGQRITFARFTLPWITAGPK